MTLGLTAQTATQAASVDWNALLVAGIGLGGVLVGGLIQIGGNEVVWRRQQRLRRVEEERLKGLAGLALAEHLETFVLQCADVVGTYWDVDWVGPHQWISGSGEGPAFLQLLPEWPQLADWKLLGLRAAVDTSNFKRRVELVKISLSGSSNFLDGGDLHCEHADQAAKLGLEAWELARLTRNENGLDPLETRKTWDFVETLDDHRRKRADIEARALAPMSGE